jgi:hypothetical protein
MAETDAALLVADHDKCGKAEAFAALHDLGDTVDMHEFIEKLGIPIIAVLAAISAVFPWCHVCLLLETIRI